jgi:ElaB/YqjD/DUF883 family membrane-anchored ribosome-binding protein
MDPDELLKELSEIVAQAEKLFGSAPEEGAAEQTADLSEGLDAMQRRLAELADDDGNRVRSGIGRADKAVRSHPYAAIALALGAGALIGMALRGGSHSSNRHRSQPKRNL